MGQNTIEAAILTVLQLHADFDSSNTSRGDWRIIGHGKGRVAIVHYGGHVRVDETLGMERITWTFNVDLYIPWKGEQSDFNTDFITERQKIIDQIAKYPTLNGTSGVLRASINAGFEPEPLIVADGSYRGHRLSLQVEEIVDPGRVE